MIDLILYFFVSLKLILIGFNVHDLLTTIAVFVDFVVEYISKSKRVK